MKSRTKKRRLYAKAKRFRASRFWMTEEDYAWEFMRPVGREVQSLSVWLRSMQLQPERKVVRLVRKILMCRVHSSRAHWSVLKKQKRDCFHNTSLAPNDAEHPRTTTVNRAAKNTSCKRQKSCGYGCCVDDFVKL